MELIARRAGEEMRVTVRRGGGSDGRYEVMIDGRAYRVDVAAAGEELGSLLIDGVQHEVSVHRQGEGRWWVSGRHGGETVEIVDPLTHLARVSRGGAGEQSRQRVDAYMPGRVVAVLVEEGAEVEEGQGVVVLEAMKMENEIAAERAGTLRKVFVEPGQAVEGGDPLFELG